MHIELVTLDDLAFAQYFLAAYRRLQCRVQWTVGPVREQSPESLARPGRPSEPGTPASRVVFLDSPLAQEVPYMQILTDSQQMTASVSFISKRGNATEVENVVFSASDPALLEVTADPSDASGATALVRAMGPIGSGQVNVTADPTVGPDVGTPVVGVLEVQVVAGAAVTAVFSTGTPTEQP